MTNSKRKYIDLGERGKLSLWNKLNDLTGKEWIKFSKSWFIHVPRRRNEDEILHPAKFPESLVSEFIRFFTKKNGWVFDPFLGTGSALIAAGETGRNALGIELNKKYFSIAERRTANAKFKTSIIPVQGDSSNAYKISNDILAGQKFDFTITSPPYWNQLERNSIRQRSRSEKGLDTKYSARKEDIGNISDYEIFIEKQALIFDQVYRLTKPKGYLTIITNNIYFNGKLFPLAFDTAVSLTKRGKFSWVLKDEKIWLQNDKALIALGVNSAWVGNRHHQYCLIFRKEK